MRLEAAGHCFLRGRDLPRVEREEPLQPALKSAHFRQLAAVDGAGRHVKAGDLLLPRYQAAQIVHLEARRTYLGGQLPHVVAIAVTARLCRVE